MSKMNRTRISVYFSCFRLMLFYNDQIALANEEKYYGSMSAGEHRKFENLTKIENHYVAASNKIIISGRDCWIKTSERYMESFQ